MTTSSGTDINGLTKGEDRINIDVLLEKALGKVNLFSNRATIDLNLAKMSNLLSQLDLTDLGMGENTHNTTVLLDAVKLELNVLGLLRVFLGILGESLSLGTVPVLVESALHLIGQMLSPHSGESAKTMRSLNISHNTNDSHGGSLKDSDSLDTVLLVDHLGTRTLNLTHHMGHTSLVSNESSQGGGGGGVKVLREGAHATSVVSGTLLGKVLERAMAGSFELTMRHSGGGS
jgi:hypothetical protein